MSSFHEQYGKLAEENAELREAYSKTLELLRAIKSKEVSLSRLSIREDGWDIAE